MLEGDVLQEVLHYGNGQSSGVCDGDGGVCEGECHITWLCPATDTTNRLVHWNTAAEEEE